MAQAARTHDRDDLALPVKQYLVLLTAV